MGMSHLRNLNGRQPDHASFREVRLQIDHLILDGFAVSGSQQRRFAAELTRALEQGLAGAGFMNSRWMASRDFSIARPPAIQLSAGGLNAGAAAKVATAVIATMAVPRNGAVLSPDPSPSQAARNTNQNHQRTTPHGKT